MKLKKLFLISSVIFTIALFCGITANAANYTTWPCGAEGSEIYCELNRDTGHMKIKGSGAMKDYTSRTEVPWYSISYEVNSIEISDGITNIGDYAFYNISFDSISIPNSIIRIGNYSFRGTSGITDFVIPDGVTNIGSHAFDNSTFQSMTIPSTVTKIENSAFYNCTSLKKVNTKSILNWCNIDFADESANPLAFAKNLYVNDVLVENLIIPSEISTIKQYSFYKCSSLKTITIPDSVTAIENMAFSSCINIAGVYISDLSAWCNITFSSATANPLYYRAKLYVDNNLIENIVIPSDITTIKDYAFNGCFSIKSITFNENVTSIGIYAFSNCPSLTTVSLSNRAESIGIRAFSECSSLSNISLPEGVKKIDAYVFYGCTSLATIELPSSLSEIGKSAFSGCTKLSEIVLPNNMATISPYTFSGCSSLNNIVFSNNITNIGEYAFNGCRSLTNIDLPNTVFVIGQYAFKNCSNISTLIIPDNLVTISDYAFADFNGLTSIVIPATVKSVGNYAFSNCVNLTNIEFENGVNHIGDYAFENCNALTQMHFPDSITSFGDKLLNGCASISEISIPFLGKTNSESDTVCLYSIFGASVSDIPEGLKKVSITKAHYLSDNVFNGCANLKDISILDGTLKIGAYAFKGCTALTSVILPNSITDIGSHAFDSCNALTNINIPTAMSEISDYTFYNFTGLKDITIPGNIKDIGICAFQNCDNLSKVTIESGTETISSSAFKNCISLKDLNLGTTIKTIYNGAFQNCTQLIQVVIPDSVLAIKDNAFNGCSSIEALILGDGLNTIGSQAFQGCSKLLDITIGSNIASIGNYAFDGCSALNKINITDVSSWCNIEFVSAKSNPLSQAGNLYLNNSLLTELIIPNDVIEIKNYAFNGLDNINSVFISDSVEKIGDYAFSASSLSEVEIGNGVTYIGQYAFWGCENLIKIGFGNKIETIDNFAFYHCDSLERISIPDSVTTLGDGVFFYSINLKDISLPDNLQKIGALIIDGTAYYNDSSNWEDNILYIGNYVVRSKGSIEKYVIKSGTKHIAGQSFRNKTNLASIVLPESIKRIEDSSFVGCTNLTDVYYYGNYTQKQEIEVSTNNDCLTNATWIYASNYTFVANGGNEVETIKSFDGITTEPQTSKDELTFAGWYTTNDFSNERVVFPYTDLADTTFYAKWVSTITYTGDYTTPAQVDIGADVTLPVCPDYGWHYDFTLNGEPWDGTNITENVTVKVTTVRNTYTVTYEGNYEGSDSALYEADVTLPTAEYGWHYNFTLNGEPWDGKNITEDITVKVTAVRNTYTVTYEGNYEGSDSALYEADVTLPTAEYGWHYNFTLNGEPWDGKNITEDIIVKVTAVRNTYTITYEGAYTEPDTALYEANVTLPTPPEGFVYTFTLDNQPWDGTNITRDITVTVVKLHDTSEISISNLENMETGGLAISGVYYRQNYVPEISATNNATYKLYTDIDCTNEVNSYTLARGMNTMYVKVTCESGRSDVYTLSINRDIPNALGALSVSQTSGANLTFKVTNTITGSPAVMVKYGYSSDNLRYEKTAVFDSKTQTVYAEDLPENQSLYFKVVAIYDEITAESSTIMEMTGENYSAECDVVAMISPIGGTIGEEEITGLKVSNKFDSITIDLEVSEYATWELHKRKLSDSKIEDCTLALEEGNNTAYVKVYSEAYTRDPENFKSAMKTYKITVYRQTKAATPVISVSGGAATITMPNGEVANIIYTLDGSIPSETNGQTYSSPINVKEGETISAIAIQSTKDEISDVAKYTMPVSVEVYIDVEKAEISGSKCIFDIYMETSVAIDGTILVGVYEKNGTLIGIKTMYVDLSECYIELPDFEVDVTGTPYEYKIMLWEDLETLRPICNAEEGNF